MAALNARLIAKASGTASEVPQAADLEVAELAINTADAVLYSKHTDGSIVTIGGSGSVDSVNSQTGIVSLGVQDMDDFALEQVTLNGTVNLNSKVTTLTADGQFKEPINNNQFIGNYILFWNEGNDHTEIDKLVAGDAVEFTFDDASTFTTTVDSKGQNLGSEDYLSVVDQWPAKAFTTTSIAIASSKFTGTGPVDVALADGDILQWVNADSKFKPTKLGADDLTDVDTTTTAPTLNQVLIWDGSNWVPGNQTGGGSGVSRTSASVATSSLADQASENIEFAAMGKTGTFVTVQTDVSAWITFYTDTSSRTSDSARNQTTSPSPGSGVLLEVITNGAQTIRITPAVGYFNDDTVLSSNLLAKVVNISGGTAVVTTTIEVVTIES